MARRSLLSREVLLLANLRMEERYLESAVEILRTMKYLTLATVCKDGAPWNTPVSASVDSQLILTWGSNSNSQHSLNIQNDARAFGVIFDSHAPEGTGEGLYLSGRVEKVGEENDAITIYRLVPEQIWINDEEKNEDGSYKNDIRIEIPVEILRTAFSRI